MKRFTPLLLIIATIPVCFNSVYAADAAVETTAETTAQAAPETAAQATPETAAQAAPETTAQAAPETTAQATPETTAQAAHTYKLVVEDCTWTQAYQAAKDQGGHLVCFETSDEYQTVLTQILNEDLDNIIFLIGGRRNLDSSDYYWDHGDGVLQGEVLNNPSSWAAPQWMQGEPSYGDTGSTESYMETYFYSGEGRWVFNDVPDDIISIVPDYSRRVGYIIEFGDTPDAQASAAENTGTGQGPTLANEGTGEGPVLENEGTGEGPVLENEGTGEGPALENGSDVPAWQTAYNDYIVNQEYLNDPAQSYGDETTQNLDMVSYALHDMNADGIPELIIFNGDCTYAGSLCYLYQYTDDGISFVGSMPCCFTADYYFADDLPGLFSSGTYMGQYWTNYYSFDGTLIEEPVSQNSDEAIYQAYQSIQHGGGTHLPFSTLNDLNQKGWDIFITEYGYTAPGSAAPAGTSDPAAAEGTSDPAAAGAASDSAAAASGSLPAELVSVLPELPMTFHWSGGAGNLSEGMTINADGTYEAGYSAMSMNPCESSFGGTLTDFTKIDDYTWSMRIDSLTYIREPGTTYKMGDATVEVIETHTSVGDTLYLYLPGYPFDQLPGGLQNYLNMFHNDYSGTNISGYALCFESDDASFNGYYENY